MIRVATALFAESVILSNSTGVLSALGIYPNVVNGLMGQTLLVDAILLINGEVGQHKADVRVRGVDDAIILQVDNADINIQVDSQDYTLRITGIAVPLPSSGLLSIDLRLPDGEWFVAGSLRVKAHAQQVEPIGTDFSSSLEAFMPHGLNG